MDAIDVRQQSLVRSQQDRLSHRSQTLSYDRSYDSPERLDQVIHVLIVVLSLCFRSSVRSHRSLRACRLQLLKVTRRVQFICICSYVPTYFIKSTHTYVGLIHYLFVIQNYVRTYSI